MVKCPFCGFTNEDGALFCEQCKSDVSGVAPAPAEAAPPAEAPIMAAVVEDTPVEAIPMVAVEEPVVAVVEEVVAIIDEPAPAVVEVVEVIEVVEVKEPEAPPAKKEEPAPEVKKEAPAPAAPAPAPAAPAAAAVAAAAAAVVAAVTPPAAPAAAPKPAGAAVTPIPAGAAPKLQVQRGLKVNDEYNIFAGENYIGRADDKPVDIDLTFQEPEDRVWVSRQHALLVFDDTTGVLTIEDLNSSNGTFVNRERVYPGQPKQLSVGSTVQIGTVHMRVKV